jgi:hypothetical protein
MSVLIQNNTAWPPSTPAAAKVKYQTTNDVQPILKMIDDAAAEQLMSGIHLVTTTADFTGTNVNTAQPVFPATEDTLTVRATTSYLFEGAFHIETTGATSHTLGLLFGGTASLTSIGYQVQAHNVATEILGAVSTIWANAATIFVVSAAVATATHHNILMKGIVRINAAGTFIPQYQWSAAPGAAGVTKANGYFWMRPFGVNTAIKVGPWA